MRDSGGGVYPDVCMPDVMAVTVVATKTGNHGAHSMHHSMVASPVPLSIRVETERTADRPACPLHSSKPRPEPVCNYSETQM